MSWSRRSLLAALALGACGFRPALAPGRRGLFAIEAPQTVAGYRLLSHLEARLGPPDTPRYQLRVTLRHQEVSTESQTRRFRILGQADWQLSEDGALLASGRLHDFASYLADGSTVATQSARTHAEARLSQTLADQIVTRIWASL